MPARLLIRADREFRPERVDIANHTRAAVGTTMLATTPAFRQPIRSARTVRGTSRRPSEHSIIDVNHLGWITSAMASPSRRARFACPARPAPTPLPERFLCQVGALDAEPV